MSIYICITTLEDPDIYGTIGTALTRADRPDKISIGLAVVSGDSFYNNITSRLPYDQVTIQRYGIEDIRGIGKGRKISRFAYNGEDYILQIDPHTFFQNSWDTFLLDVFNEALQETKNEKTILTAGLGSFTVVDGKATVVDDMALYSGMTAAQWSNFMKINFWKNYPLSKFPNNDSFKDKRIVPSNKTNGNFIFGNSFFAQYSGLPESAQYLDEEIMQAVYLLEAGFSLAHPNMALPLTHRYNDTEVLQRQNPKSLLWEDPLIPECLVTKNMYDFIKNNKDMCARYADYSHYDIVTGIVDPFYVPNSFSY